MNKIKRFESYSPLRYSGRDVTRMPIIGTAKTLPIGDFDAAEYKVVEIIKDHSGKDVYVCDFWHKGRIPQLIHSEFVEEFIPSAANETSATGGPSSGGEVLSRSSGRSGLGGQTLGMSWASGGGPEQPGQISVPYNPSGPNRVFQKIPAEMGKNHGARTGKKSREKKLDIKSLKSMFAKRQDYTAGEGEARPSRVMSYDSFAKDDMNTVKREAANDASPIKRFESFGMNRDACDRCGKPTGGKNGLFGGTTIMSVFNQDVICIPCKEEEKKDPDYEAAVKAEHAAIRKGDYNFPGIYPDYKPLIRK